ncbi:MAG: riboflavin kinase [Candidatus Binataceae bacterium]|nr:riboflavin kinase [Candidatus Binataceae bacterium]
MRPTFGPPARSFEVHIFDFYRDIYGAKVMLDLLEQIRGERQFDSGAALATQIAEDLKRAREIVAAAG